MPDESTSAVPPIPARGITWPVVVCAATPPYLGVAADRAALDGLRELPSGGVRAVTCYDAHAHDVGARTTEPAADDGAPPSPELMHAALVDAVQRFNTALDESYRAYLPTAADDCPYVFEVPGSLDPAAMVTWTRSLLKPPGDDDEPVGGWPRSVWCKIVGCTP